MTTTTSSPPTFSPDGNASTAPSTPRKRSIRCMRCSGRKFHTSKDLALHILSKHSRAHINLSDSVKDSLQEDARSITVSSPQIISAQIAELDNLLAAHEKETKQSRVKSHEKVSQSTKKLIKRKRSSTVTHREQKKANLAQQKRKQRNHIHVQADSNRDTDSVSDSYSQPIFFDSGKENRNESNERMRKTRKLSKSMSPADGESIGPTSADVLVRNCRERRVPLVPELKPTQVLNFANALF